VGFDRDRFRKLLEESGVGTGVHYPVPVHRQRPYTGLEANCPAAERAASEIVSIPVHPALSHADRERVAYAVSTAA
jgi:dTDP-4-amino-4,6-dideoxygalactose transaminase